MVLHRMFAVFDTCSTCREEVIRRLIISCVHKVLLSCVRKVRYAWPLVEWIKTHSFTGHSDGHPAQSSTTPISVCSGRAMPFRPCCAKLCRHAIDAQRRDQGARGTAGHPAV